MLSSFKRKIRQLRNDPVLRSWLVRRACHLEAAPPSFEPHVPPYLADALPTIINNGTWAYNKDTITSEPLASRVCINAAGTEVEFDPSAPEAYFLEPVGDIEVELALHRFAWLPLQPQLSKHVLHTMWRTWKSLFFVTDGMHWHPYTTAERAINIIDASLRDGLPCDADELASSLAVHAQKILDQLEYFGDHNTSNHLANNGRGLYRIGCAISSDETAKLGCSILIEEAGRIFGKNGVLREGSIHYHALYTRNYLDAWRCAERHNRTSEADRLKKIASRLVSAGKALNMPGRMALIGDISPDCPPSYLSGIYAARAPWNEYLQENDAVAVATLINQSQALNVAEILDDGWLRGTFGPWDILSYAPADGWPFMPGHAHQDLSSAEIHLNGEPLFLDPGRGAYGEDGDAAKYRSAKVHGGIRVDELDPFPANKPYYSATFRRKIAGDACGNHHDNGVSVVHGGYRRIGIEDTSRRWTFQTNGMCIEDRLEGVGRHVVERSLVVGRPVEVVGSAAKLAGAITISSESAQPECEVITVWDAYGEGHPATRIVFNTPATLPWHGTINVRIED